MSTHAKSPRPLPTQLFLSESLEYCPASGLLTWKVRPLSHFKNAHGMNTFNAQHAGKSAGHISARGYVTVALEGTHFLAHRVIWKLVTGRDPVAEIDHWNEDKGCNVWTNLREATHLQNTANRGPSARSATGVKGVVWDRERNRFASFITLKGKSVFLGRFDTKDAAAAAYRAAEHQAHGDFANNQGASL